MGSMNAKATALLNVTGTAMNTLTGTYSTVFEDVSLRGLKSIDNADVNAKRSAYISASEDISGDVDSTWGKAFVTSFASTEPAEPDPPPNPPRTVAHVSATVESNPPEYSRAIPGC